MCGWLPPCHEGAADCRPDHFLFSVSSCTSSLAHLHSSSLLQPFRYQDQKGFQSHIHSACSQFLMSISASVLKFFHVVNSDKITHAVHTCTVAFSTHSPDQVLRQGSAQFRGSLLDSLLRGGSWPGQLSCERVGWTGKSSGR